MQLKSFICIFISTLCFNQLPEKIIAQHTTSKISRKQIREECWQGENVNSLLDTLKGAMKRQIEDEYKHHDFIQTYGCAYEEDDIEQNSIKAVYRAIVQSLMNRKVTFRDDMLTLLRDKPPRPDNLTREYIIYVNLPVDTEVRAARYEIKILELEAIPTIESEMSVWTRIVSRFAYKNDFNKAPKSLQRESEFVEVMEKAQKILQAAEHRNFSNIEQLVSFKSAAVAYPARITDLIFGDIIKLFLVEEPEKSYRGVFIGKGMYVADIPKYGVVVCKFGEERLYGMQIDADSFQRNTASFEVLDYEAPESILQCLFLKFNSQKPAELPPIITLD